MRIIMVYGAYTFLCFAVQIYNIYREATYKHWRIRYQKCCMGRKLKHNELILIIYLLTLPYPL